MSSDTESVEELFLDRARHMEEKPRNNVSVSPRYRYRTRAVPQVV